MGDSPCKGPNCSDFSSLGELDDGIGRDGMNAGRKKDN